MIWLNAASYVVLMIATIAVVALTANVYALGLRHGKLCGYDHGYVEGYQARAEEHPNPIS